MESYKAMNLSGLSHQVKRTNLNYIYNKVIQKPFSFKNFLIK